MAAYADLASLLSNIEQMMAHPHLSSSFDNNQIKSLHGKADELLKFIINNYYGVGTKEAEDLERQIASAAQVAEDVIESHIVDRIHAGSDQASLECLLDLQPIIEGMDAVMRKAAQVGEKWRLREEQPTHRHMEALEQKAAEKQPLPIGEISPVGLEDDVVKLMDKLCVDQPKRHIISIVGMGGSGKTTLAQYVYNNLLIKEHFHIRAWATVSQQYSEQEILSQLLSCLGKKGGKDLGQELYQTLSGRMYLIILDDIWSADSWNQVRHFFPDNGNGSRVVLTSRLSDVARECLSYFCFTMNLLDDDSSWQLLCEKAFQQENCPYPELEEVGKRIARFCRGLPLSIVVIGGLLLNSPKTVGFWQGFARNIKSIPNAKEKQESLGVLSLSYNHLPPHFKPCFLYMSVFKEDSVIRVSKIIKLWVAEGFVRPNHAQHIEDIAEDYLKDMISRNLVLVDKFRHDGRIGSCRIHDLLRDLCLNLAQQQDFFNVTNNEYGGPERRLISENWNFDIGPPLARSIMARVYRKQLVKYKLLRVLDVISCGCQAEVYDEKVNLRYLAYKPYQSYQQPVWELPTSLSLLWNLQTLIISQDSSTEVVIAPIQIWKMRQLRHVICSKIYVPDPLSSNGQDNMENLQTLTTALNFRWSEEVSKIIPNIKKLHLFYDRHLQGYDYSLIGCLGYLGLFHRLESLKVEMISSVMNKKVAFPSSLNKLSLKFSKLHWGDLTMIGSLPHLQVLNLGILSVADMNNWSPTPGQFLQLKVLKIDQCSLVCWEADDSDFPVLEKLVLSRLSYLKEIPLSIGDIPTLGLIHVECCYNLSVAISAMRIKEYQWEYQGIDSLQIQVKVHDYEQHSFEQMVDSEELKMNDIQFQTY